jgi:hypothetical protein
MGAWQGVAMDSLKFHPGLPCPTLLNPAGGPPLKRPYSCFKDGLQPSSTFLDTPHRTPMRKARRVARRVAPSVGYSLGDVVAGIKVDELEWE